MKKRIFIPSTLCGFAVIMCGCAGDTSTHNTTNINNVTVVQNSSGNQSDLPKFDIKAAIKEMDGDIMLSGESSDAGIWVVYRATVKGNVDKNQMQALAEVRAKRGISEWLSVSVSKKASMQSQMTTKDGKIKSSVSYSSLTKVNSESFLRGLTLYSISKNAEEEGTDFIFYVTGKTADRTAELEAQLRAAPPGVVRAVGFGMVVNNKVFAAQNQAVQAALRNAVEQVMGTTVIANSQLMDNVKLKSKVISQTVGNVKEHRIVKEARDGDSYQVIINARVDEQSLLDNYAAIVRSMGNPGFAVKCKDPDLKLALSDFFATLGFKVTADPADTQFVVDADCDYRTVQDDYYGKGIQIAVRLKIFDATSNQQLLFTSNNPRLTSTYSGSYHQIRQLAAQRAFKTMKEELHRKLNKVVMDWVLNGREVKVVFKNAAPALDETLVQMIKDVPCAKYQTRSRNGNDLVIHCSYVGPSADFEEFLLERFKRDMSRGTALPKTQKIELNNLEFSF